MFTIYFDLEAKSGKVLTSVLLTCGSWTNQDACNQRVIYNAERDGDGIVMHKPKLFHTAGGARNYLKTHLPDYPCYRVAKYTGPTDPMARPAKVY